ncbi:GPI transamidase subunit PIG-U domain-containing protein [Ditylenchus destructor]|uniref:GPI transamidase subunit PIG-U domain-containing protein n=1 Tax=Ditylenchus destructor TaxID=166010 RepID=A0AAD4N3P5_9BILA|nr:GPI transamidase subunit PIG-U domain-containing protein [Ditylenchus destructor]
MPESPSPKSRRRRKISNGNSINQVETDNNITSSKVPNIIHDKMTTAEKEPNTDFKYKCVVLAVALRLLAYFYLTGFFETCPQLVTPWNSFKRFKEGIFLHESGTVDDVYDGDMFHVILDLFTAFFIDEFVRNYVSMRAGANADCADVMSRKMGNIAFAGYLLNPMTIGSWTVLNYLIFSVIALGIAAQLNVYHLVLLAVIILNFKNRLPAVLMTIFFIIGSLFAVNFLLVENPLRLFHTTIGFFLTVPDLSPNVGIFWYFFAQVFEHYRLLFLFAFQFNVLIHIAPLSITLRKNPYVLAVSLLMFIAIFSSYPSYAETALYLPYIAAFTDMHKYIRHGLVLGSTLVATVVLTPIMWRIWVETGTGNANFFFAITWVFNLAQIFILADFVGAYLRFNLIQNCEQENAEEKIESIRLVTASLI